VNPTTHGRMAAPELEPCRRSGPSPRALAWGCRGLGPLLRCRVYLGSTGRLFRAILLALLLGVHPATVWAAAAEEVAGDELILEVHPEKSRAYLHEAVPVTVTLLAGSVSVRNIEYPRLDGAAFRISEFSPPRRSSVARNGREYTAYEFAATLIPRESGEIELGPAELRCDLLAAAGGAAAFFGGSEPRTVTVRSKPVRFSILPLPTRGRPAGYTGAVGRFTLSRQVTPTAIQIGDPITLTTRIEGVGNIDSYSCESISLPGVRAYPSRARRVGKRLTCEQVLVPEAAASVEIPAALISFFDPLSERYRTATSPSVPLALTGAHSGQTREMAPVAAVKARSAPAPSGTSRWPLWAALAAVLLVSAGAALLATRRRRAVLEHTAAVVAVARQSLAEAEAALAANDPQRFYEAIFRLAQASAAARLNLPSPGMTVGMLNHDGSGEPTHHFLAELFQECDAVRYGRSARDRQDMLRTFKRLQEVIADPS